MCDLDFQCHFVNNDRNFTLNAKTSNDALYLRDGIHLNSMGSEKLVDNLELRNLAFVQKPATRISYPNHGHFPFSANRVDLHPYDRPPPVIENPGRSVRSAPPRPSMPVEQWATDHRSPKSYLEVLPTTPGFVTVNQLDATAVAELATEYETVPLSRTSIGNIELN